MDPMIAKMISTAHQALKHSYAPYSKFTVASCLQTDKGNLYTGINVENSSYGLSLCAETSAIAAMVSAGERNIKSMVVLAGSNELCTPCGACRQSLLEYETKQNEPIEIYFSGIDGAVYKCDSIKDLLPFSFDASFL